MKNLYITDLDGTLFNSQTKVTPYSAKIINEIIQKGHYFSFATARSLYSANSLTKNLKIEIPVVVHNGIFLINPITEEPIVSNYYSNEENIYLKNAFKKFERIPTLYSYINGINTISMMPEKNNKSKDYYISTRQNDKKFNIVTNIDELYKGNIYYCLTFGTFKELNPLFTFLKTEGKVNPILTNERNDEYWLTILPKSASKALTTKKLKQYLKADKIICFGNDFNDLSMFKIADECYAVDNALPEIKKFATGIIASNDNDGVANWLKEHLLD